jgi:hypothetical protein
MGRPIHKKYFANRNYQLDGEGVGGEGITAVITVSNSGTVYSQGTVVTIGAPQIAGGEQATISYSINSAGNITVTRTAAGSGYTSAPSLTVTTATGVVSVTTGSSGATVIYPAFTTGIYAGMKVIGTGISASATYVTSVVGGAVNLTWPNASAVSGPVITMDAGASFSASTALTAAARENGLAMYAYLPASGAAGYLSGAGGSSRLLSDVIRQAGNNKYVVQNSEGVGVVRLVADGSAANAAGEADLTATDWNGSTYRVIKLHAKKARLKQVTSSTAFLIEDGAWAQWTITAATGTTVLLANA